MELTLVLVDLLPSPEVVLGAGDEPVLTLVDLLPSVRVEEASGDDLVLTMAPVFKGDPGRDGPPGADGAPGRDASPADVIAALAAGHSLTLRALDGSVIATVYGDPT